MDRNSSFNKTSYKRSSPSSAENRISAFCSVDSFPQRLNFLNQELSMYGYPSIESCGSLDKIMVVNVTYDLLKNYRKTLEAHSETADDLRSYENDAARSQHLLSLAKEDNANKDRELKSKCIEEAHLLQRVENLRKKYKAEQEKCRRMSAELLSRDSQYKHEKKKKQQEIEKLQAKLNQLLQDKRHERMLGIEILNSLQRTDGKRGKWNTDKTKKNNEQEMYRLIITNYEDSQKQLLNENADMRKYLKQMQDELIAALNEKVINSDKKLIHGSSSVDRSRSDSIDFDHTSTTSDESDLSVPVSEGVFEMPYDLVKEDIEKSLKSKWKALRKMHKQRSQSDLPQVKENEICDSSTDLSTKFLQYETAIKEQQQVIDYLTTCQEESKGAGPGDSYFLEEKAELEKSKSTFYRQRLAFEKERKLYTDALLQLGQDRQTFEEEKSKWFQNNFLQLTPFQNESAKNKAISPSGRKASRRKRLSSSWNETSFKAEDEDYSSPIRNARGVADGMGTSGDSPNNSPLNAKSSNLEYAFSSPDDINPWTESSPPVPSTCELYRALGLRYPGKENQQSSFACTPVHATSHLETPRPSISKSETNLNITSDTRMAVLTSSGPSVESLSKLSLKTLDELPYPSLSDLNNSSWLGTVLSLSQFNPNQSLSSESLYSFRDQNLACITQVASSAPAASANLKVRYSSLSLSESD